MIPGEVIPKTLEMVVMTLPSWRSGSWGKHYNTNGLDVLGTHMKRHDVTERLL